MFDPTSSLNPLDTSRLDFVGRLRQLGGRAGFVGDSHTPLAERIGERVLDRIEHTGREMLCYGIDRPGAKFHQVDKFYVTSPNDLDVRAVL